MRDKDLEGLFRRAEETYRRLQRGQVKKFDELSTKDRNPLVNACADLLLLRDDPRGPNFYRHKIHGGLRKELAAEIDLHVGHTVFHRCVERKIEHASVLGADLMIWHLEDHRRKSRVDPDDLITALPEPLFNLVLDRRAALGLTIPLGGKSAIPAADHDTMVKSLAVMAFCESLKKPDDDAYMRAQRSECTADDLKRALRSIQEIDADLEAQLRADVGERIYKTAIEWKMGSLPPLAESFVLVYIDAYSAEGGNLDELFARLDGALAKTLVEARVEENESEADTKDGEVSEGEAEGGGGPGQSTD